MPHVSWSIGECTTAPAMAGGSIITPSHRDAGYGRRRLPPLMALVLCLGAWASAVENPVVLGCRTCELHFAADGKASMFLKTDMANPCATGDGFIVIEQYRNGTAAKSWPLSRLSLDAAGHLLAQTAVDAVPQKAVTFDVIQGPGLNHVGFKMVKDSLHGFPAVYSADAVQSLRFRLHSGDQVEAVPYNYMVRETNDRFQNIVGVDWGDLSGVVGRNDDPGGFSLFPFTTAADRDETLLHIWTEAPVAHPRIQGLWTLERARTWLQDWRNAFVPHRGTVILKGTMGQLEQGADDAAIADASEVLLLSSNWLKTSTGEVDSSFFPNKETDLTRFSRDVRARSRPGRPMYLALHTPSGAMSYSNPAAWNAPAGGLANWGGGSLVQAFKAVNGVYPTTISFRPDADVIVVSPGAHTYNMIRIGTDLIQFDSVTKAANGDWTLNGCKRPTGAPPAYDHEAGAHCEGLVVASGSLIPDNWSDYLDVRALAFAGLINRTETARVLLDNAELHAYFGGTVNKFAEFIYRGVDHPTLSSSSGGGALPAWFEFRFSGADDAREAGGAIVRLRSTSRNASSLLMADYAYSLVALIQKPRAISERLTPASIRSMGFSSGDDGINDVTTFAKHGLRTQLLEHANMWRVIAGELTPAISSRLLYTFGPGGNCLTGNQLNAAGPRPPYVYVPEERSGGYDLYPVAVLDTGHQDAHWYYGGENGPIEPWRFLKPNEAEARTWQNPFAAQALRFILHVLPATDYASSENYDIQPVAANMQAQAGYSFADETGGLRMRRATAGAETWTLTGLPGMAVAHPNDWSTHRPLGMYVDGDAHNELLMLRLLKFGTGDHDRDYAVPVDFSTRRYVEIPHGEAAYALSKWGWRFDAGKARKYEDTHGLSLGFGYLPSNTVAADASVRVSGLKALKEIPVSLVNPVITTSQGTLRVTGAVPTDGHLEYQGGSTAILYDADWNRTGELPVAITNQFRIPAGDSAISITTAQNGPMPWLGVQFLTRGEPVPVDVHSPPTYALRVIAGLGSGRCARNESATITADPPSILGQVFDRWEFADGDTAGADVKASTTTLTMPARAVTVTATYRRSATPIATIIMTCDNAYDMYVNGTWMNKGDDPAVAGRTITELKTGRNVIAVKGRNLQNLAGLLADIAVDLHGRNTVDWRLGTSSTWRISAANQVDDAWMAADFNDSTWSAATEFGVYGSGPWGKHTSGMPEDTMAQWIWSSNNASSNSTVYFRFVIDVPENAAPTVATPAQAGATTVHGTATTLSVLGADDGGEAGLTYTWTTVGTPPAAVRFSANGTNGAKTTTATFASGGVYRFQVAITDAGNLTVSSEVDVQVDQVPATLVVNPSSASVPVGMTRTFTATVVDQFGLALTVTTAWAVSGGGVIHPASGVFTAGGMEGGPYTVTATAGEMHATAQVRVDPVTGSAPTVVTPAAADPSPVTGTTTTLSVLGADDGGEGALIYAWSVTGSPPAGVSFSINGTNASKVAVATFGAVGIYDLQVEIADAVGLTAVSTVRVVVGGTTATASEEGGGDGGGGGKCGFGGGLSLVLGLLIGVLCAVLGRVSMTSGGKHGTRQVLLILALGAAAATASATTVPDTFIALQPGDTAPTTAAQLWAGYDPRSEALNIEVLGATEDTYVKTQYVRFQVGTFNGQAAKIVAFYACPKAAAGTRFPAVLEMHGTGNHATFRFVHAYARNGYAAMSLNWGGNVPDFGNSANTMGTYTYTSADNNLNCYFSLKGNLLPSATTIDRIASPRNNDWFKLQVATRRALTFLEQQPAVDGARMGACGFSVGGSLTTMLAGIDTRLKAGVPEAGGAGGVMTTDLDAYPPGCHASEPATTAAAQLAEAMSGTLSFQLASITCPMQVISATNDTSACINNIAWSWQRMPATTLTGFSFPPHLDHRAEADAHELTRLLWFENHLKSGAFIMPPIPAFSLETVSGKTPVCRVTPGVSAHPISRVDIYYSIGIPYQNRFWRDAKAVSKGGYWEAACPIMGVDQPIFAYANVTYATPTAYRTVEQSGYNVDSDVFTISSRVLTATPGRLTSLGVSATDTMPERMIDDGLRSWHDWYGLLWRHESLWQAHTRKPTDPKWCGPDTGGRLVFEIQTTKANKLAIICIDGSSLVGETSYAVVKDFTGSAQWQTVSVGLNDFTPVLAGWKKITRLVIGPKGGASWPQRDIRRMRWEGGLYADDRRPPGSQLTNVQFNTLIDEALQEALWRLDHPGAAPTVATPASAGPTPVTGTTTTLSVLGADDGGEASLHYSWSVTGSPPAAVTFTVNGTNAAKSTVATFTVAGTYGFQVVISDADGLTATSNVSVVVTRSNAAPTVATPASAGPAPVTGTTTTLSVLGADDGGEAALRYAWSVTGSPPAAVTFTVNGTNAAKSTVATFTAAGTYGFQVVITDAAGLAATSKVSVVVTMSNAAPTVATPASAGPDPVAGAVIALSVLGTDDGGEAALRYDWSVTGPPSAAVAFSVNGVNAAKATGATCDVAGTYDFQVVITDAAGLTATSGLTVIVAGPPSSSSGGADAGGAGACGLGGGVSLVLGLLLGAVRVRLGPRTPMRRPCP